MKTAVSKLSCSGGGALAILATVLLSPAAFAATSSLPDDSVIQALFPKHVRIAAGEDCVTPAKADKSTGIALFSVNTHPKNPDRVMVSFSLLYKQDCGMDGHWSAHGVDPHPGDAEYFFYTLKQDSTCSKGWRVHALKTVAHSGEPSRREINEKILNSCDAPNEIVASLGKHALYTSWLDCTKRFPAEICINGDDIGFTLYNISSNPDLSTLFGGSDKLYSSEGDGKFCGGQNVTRSKCVDAPGDKLKDPSSHLKSWEFPDPDLGGSHKCPYGLDEDAGLCYKPCDSGFKGVATRCLANCPDGYRDDGLYCAKHSHTRASYAWEAKDGVSDKGMFKRCEAKHGAGNCEKEGAIVYEKCGSGFSKVGCCICQTTSCPAKMKDIGVSCEKNSYDRGAGVLP